MLKIDREKLSALLNDFYRVTDIKICVCDEEGSERSYAPKHLCEFCEYVRSSPAGREACRRSDEAAFAECRRTGKPYSYSCHIGLTECVSPIMQTGRPIGFVMIGQTKSGKASEEEVRARAEEYGLDAEKALALYSLIERADEDKVRSAAAIMDACASYLYLNRLIAEGESLSRELGAYVAEHCKEPLSVDGLCRIFRLSRVDLYSCFRQAYRCTPAAFIRKTRLARACELLERTDLPIARIAREVGIDDYNYFSKLFRAQYALSPRAYRKRTQITENA